LALPSENLLGDLRFSSVRALEQGLDGSEARFARYFYAIYRCPHDDDTPWGNCQVRNELRAKYPDKAINVGNRFVLTGRPAFEALSCLYQALAVCDTQSNAMRAYWKERLDEITVRDRDSQSLPVPIDLTEAQLGYDAQLEFLTCIALMQGQVFLKAEIN